MGADSKSDIELLIEPEQVTADWLSQVLAANQFSGVVQSVRSEPIGTGQSAHSERFHLDYATGTGPATVVGKFPSPDPTSRATGHDHGSYLREINFYREIAPTVDIRLPKILHADLKADNSDFVLLMEDLAPARQGDQMLGCDLATAQAALCEVAKLHAPRWDDPVLPAYSFLSGSDSSERLPDGLIEMFWTGFTNRYAEELTPDIRAVGVGLVEHWGNYSATYRGARTVTHGDYRLDNLLIDTQGDEVRVTSVDWQTAGVGSGASDVAYFIGAGLPAELRREHETELLRFYLEQLHSRGVTNYDFDQLFSDYRRYAYAGYFMAVIASMLVVQTQRGDEMFMTMANRHGQHVLDLDSLATIS